MARDERVYIRVSTEEKAKLQKLADKDNRSLSDYIRVSILKNIKEEVEMNYEKYWVLGIKEGLEEIIHQGNNKEIAVEEGKDYWDRLYPEDKKRNKIQVREILPVDCDEDGVVNYDYSILWESK